MFKNKSTYLKLLGLVLLGVAFSSQIKTQIRKYIPALADVLDKGENV